MSDWSSTGPVSGTPVEDLTFGVLDEVAASVLPVEINENSDVSAYSLVANLLKDELTERMMNEPVNNESLNKMDEKDKEVLIELVKLAKQQGERRLEALEEDLSTINLGLNEEVKEVKIDSFLQGTETDDLISLLREFSDVFAWCYEDKPGLNPSITEYRIPTWMMQSQ